MRSEVSPVDEVIKMAVMRGTLGLITRHNGTLPQDDDVSGLGGWMPVVSRRNEPKWVLVFPDALSIFLLH